MLPAPLRNRMNSAAGGMNMKEESETQTEKKG
jgi:hypothetical protein